MGTTPRREGITISFNCQFEVFLKDSHIATILGAFATLLPQLLTDFFQKVTVGFGEYSMALKKKPFTCKCGNNEAFIWKTRHGKKTKIHGFYRWLELRQLQIQCKRCGSKMYITRKLLGMEPMKRIAPEIYRKLGLLGSLTTFRVAEKIGGMFGWAVDKMTIWNAVQKTASEIDFKLDADELPHGEADGTGVGIKGIAKHGKELKVFIQYKKGGGVRVAGLDIGDYNRSWNNLFQNSLEIFKSFSQFLLVTDGDTAILDGLKNKVKIIFQRCLWHIPHQAKYAFWKDSVKLKSPEWLYLMSEIMEICAIRPFVDCQETIAMMVESKKKRLEKIISHCQENGYTRTVSYLKHAQPGMFTALENRLNGKTTSRVERVMRTVNMRTNVSKWSKSGVLNVNKVRLAYYYNDFDA